MVVGGSGAGNKLEARGTACSPTHAVPRAARPTSSPRRRGAVFRCFFPGETCGNSYPSSTFFYHFTRRLGVLDEVVEAGILFTEG